MDERIKNNGTGLANDMSSMGYPSTFIKGCNSPLGDTYFFDLVNPLDYNKRGMKDAIVKLGVAHRLDMQLKDTKETHYAIFVPNEEHITLSLYGCLTDTNWQKNVIGKDERGNYVYLDFNKIPHLLIAGTTGSGKSILLHNIIINRMCVKNGRKFEMLIIDAKGSEFRQWQGVKGITFCENTGQAIKLLRTCEKVMDERYKSNNPMGNQDIFIIIDELADLMLTTKYEIENSIMRLSQMGRACGIHLIVATQYPINKVISPIIKANMPYRICLKMATIRQSVAVMDKKGAEQLRGKGDCIVRLGVEDLKAQVAFVEKEFEDAVIEKVRG